MLLPILILSLAGSEDRAARISACLEGKTTRWLQETPAVQAALRDALAPEATRLRPGNVRQLDLSRLGAESVE